MDDTRRRAAPATVHVGAVLRGDGRAAERAVAGGTMPARPFVLVGPAVPRRPALGRRTSGTRSTPTRTCRRLHRRRDRGDRGQIERFAPGFKDRVLARHVRSVAEMEAHNPNYVGGDVVTGANVSAAARVPPTHRAQPLRGRRSRRLPVLGGDPAGAGAHGMCGYNAAKTALAKLR